MTPATYGAFGMEIRGLPRARPWLQEVPAPLERLDVVRETGAGPAVVAVDGERAGFRMVGGVLVETRRDTDRIVVRSEGPVTDDDLLHPHISPTLAVRHLWSGRQVLHGGVVGTPDGAVFVLGGREFGKSTTLADLAARSSVVVFSDDLCITDGRVAWTGPRCIDLRASAVAAVDGGDGGSRPRVVRSATRWRMSLGAAPPAVRLVGPVLLGWAPHTRVARMPPAEALGMVVACKMHAEIPSDPVALLSVGALPMLAIERAHDLSSLSWTSGHIEEWVYELVARRGADQEEGTHGRLGSR